MFYCGVFWRAGSPNFDAALRDVHAKDPKFKLAAAKRLARPDATRQEEALQALFELGSDKIGPIRHAAMESLADFPTPEGEVKAQTFAFAKEALSDLDYNVRRAAVAAACQHADDDTELSSLLRSLLADSRQEMRFEACNAISEFVTEEDELLSLIKIGISDGHQSVRFAAVRAASDHMFEFEALSTLVFPCLEDDDLEVRRISAVALAQSGDNAGGSVLIACLSDPSWMLDALMSLATAPFEPAREPLSNIAGGFFRPLTIRAAASAALVALEDPRGVSGLRSVLTAFRSDGRAFAVDLVGRFKVTQLQPELQKLLNSRGTVPKEQIQEALASLT